MLTLTGITDDQRSNYKIMKSVGEYTKLTANNRMKETIDMIKYIGEDEDILYEINEKPQPLKGHKLPAPHILLGKQR